MVYRYSWIAGIAAVGFAFWQLGSLLLPSSSGAKWQLVVLSGFIIGLVVTWTAVTYRLSAFWIVLVNGAALFLAAARFSAPEESVLVFPTRAGTGALWTALGRALALIQHGIEPVRPIAGMVIVLTTLFWLLGLLLAWGLSKGHPFVALLPPLVAAILFATIDRRTNGIAVLGMFVVLVAVTIFAVALDERDRGAGRMASSRSGPPSNRPAPAAALLVVAAVAAAVFGVGLLGPLVPRDGAVTWRTPGGLGGGYFGSKTYNPYVQIHKNLVSRDGIPLFRARINGDVVPTDVSFRLLTLETYDNGRWWANRPLIYRFDDPPLEEPGYEYAGPTKLLTADIEILALAQEWLPAPYAVTGIEGDDAEAFRIRRTDTAIAFKGDRTYQNMSYQVAATVPVVDPALIAGDPDGGFSPLFTAALESGESVPVIGEVEYRELPDAERYLQLPDNVDSRIGEQAVDITERLSTPFEKGLAIEHWFRETGGFVYDLDTDQGHSDDVLASWLFDDSPENASYRRGYCEQFATSMAVMSRSIGIPTRVVLGFTPGTRTGANEVVVLDKNAHSWVELWIPAVGWVSFDPTPRSDDANPGTSYRNLTDALGFEIAAYLGQIPEPVRPEITPDQNPIGGVLAPGEDRRDPGFIEQIPVNDSGPPLPGWTSGMALAIAFIILFLAGIPIVKWAGHRSRMRRLADGDISAAWEEIVVRLTDFGEEPDPAATPLEVAATVDDAMKPLASVYSRSVYGRSEEISSDHTDAARRSMQITSDRLSTRYSPLERLRSHYRMGSLMRRFRP